MNLSYREVMHILNCIERVHGFGYSKDPEVSALQGRLSIHLEVRHKLGDSVKDPIPSDKINWSKIAQLAFEGVLVGRFALVEGKDELSVQVNTEIDHG